MSDDQQTAAIKPSALAERVAEAMWNIYVASPIVGSGAQEIGSWSRS